ncbi:DUF2806 domain-containing protein [Limoniibacter endophyticus]|uniref:DUF2806 domain-containing protein n=1 Tax=Limoniibacter endophyticus TaxID=1565040 RepID=A0A8J3GJP1_9HYPH|nr:DUF2806 domain-containing protein [Limoniibacter endophyticus]GHC79426.1 hypothetical protein GCM10010136_31950 [Limoniibacter endophyticus]
MSNDPLNRETSISAELTENGVKATTNSRSVAGLDRLLGNFVDMVNLPMEERNQRRRLRIEGEKMLSEVLLGEFVSRMGKDKAFADRALETHLNKIARQQENKDAVALEAFLELKANPDDGGPETDVPLSSEFLDKLETYSENASTEELRQRWGKVLAAEAKRPGTFTGKVMRIVDELSPDVAQLFEGLVQRRIGKFIPKCLVEEIPTMQLEELSASGLIVPASLGQSLPFSEEEMQNGEGLFLRHIGIWAIGILRTKIKDTNSFENTDPIRITGNNAAIPTYVLSTEGEAVASILIADEAMNFSKISRKIAEVMPPQSVIWYKIENNEYKPMGVVSPA